MRLPCKAVFVWAAREKGWSSAWHQIPNTAFNPIHTYCWTLRVTVTANIPRGAAALGTRRNMRCKSDGPKGVAKINNANTRMFVREIGDSDILCNRKMCVTASGYPCRVFDNRKGMSVKMVSRQLLEKSRFSHIVLLWLVTVELMVQHWFISHA